MRIILWTNLCCVLFIASSDATILRLPCKIIAEFNVLQLGKRLMDHVLMSFYGLQDTQCMVKCVENMKCRSYNTNKNDGRCEINGKALVDSGTILKADSHWTYKSTDYSLRLVGPVCKSLNPCGDKTLCKDSCDPPYYKCVYCDADHDGLHCDASIDRSECSSNPCQNSGICVDKFAAYECTCLNGCTGKNCEIDIDECMSLPCLHGGSCINEIGNYTCNCTSAVGYTGRICEEEMDECLSSPCKNLGRCVDQFADYKCICVNGFTGKKCESDINECLNSPCLNNGSCTNEYGNYTCNCTNAIGYVGRNCERSQFVLYQSNHRWEDAKQQCIVHGGSLAIIRNAVELSIVKGVISIVKSSSYIWVALSDKEEEGTFVWNDGTNATDVQWGVNEPGGGTGENCGVINSITKSFYDAPCSDLFYYICKYK